LSRIRRDSSKPLKIYESVFQPEFKEDLGIWTKENRVIAEKIIRLIKETLRDPFHGLGKPEPLKYFGSDVWSRRITQEHRFVYKVSEDGVDFLQCRYHY
jgi:toxin YoeB